jgi:hypothetical protein
VKYFTYPIVIYLITFGYFNMAMADHFKNDLCHYQKIDLPYSSRDLEKYYYWDDEIGALHLLSNEKLPFRFQPKEYSYTPKLQRFTYKNSFYFPAVYFNYKNIVYKGIVYMYYGDNDNPIFIFQLNSYDAKGHFIDAIVLDERLSAEGEALWWSDFKIQANGKILVNQIEQTLIDNDPKFKNGDIHFLKKSVYQMTTSDEFKKVKEKIINAI